MSATRSQSQAAGSPPRRFVLARRNLIILALALVVLVAGYLTLRAGHPSAAAVILSSVTAFSFRWGSRSEGWCWSSRHGPCAVGYLVGLGSVPRANSSAGSERLPYTQDVGGSNPSSPIAPARVARLML